MKLTCKRWFALAGLAIGLAPFKLLAIDYVTAEDSYVRTDRDRDANYGAGGADFAGFKQNDWLSIETGIFFAGVHERQSDQSDAHLLLGLEGALKARAVQFGPASLFFRASGGVEYAKPESAAKFSPTLSPGVGFQYRLFSHLSVVLEADERFAFGSPGHGKDVDHDLWANIGLVLDLPHGHAGLSAAEPPAEVVSLPPTPPVPIAPPASSTREVHFAFDSARLSDDAKKDVLDIAQLLLASQELVIELRGNADSVGNKFYNLDLSRRRAEAVENELVADGVASQRIALRADGKYFPAEDNKTAEGRTENRRVVVLIYPGIPEMK